MAKNQNTISLPVVRPSEKLTTKQKEILTMPSEVPYNFKDSPNRKLTPKEFVHTKNVILRLKKRLESEIESIENPAYFSPTLEAFINRESVKRHRKKRVKTLKKFLAACAVLVAIPYDMA